MEPLTIDAALPPTEEAREAEEVKQAKQAEEAERAEDHLSPIEAVLRNQVLGQHARSMHGDYFQVLGVEPGATRAQIEEAHASLSMAFAEGALSLELARGLATELRDIREVLDEAARLMGNDALRARYRASLRAATPTVEAREPANAHDRR